MSVRALTVLSICENCKVKEEKMPKATTFEFSEFKPGYFLAWTITSQCGNTGSVKITAGNTTLVTARKITGDWNLKLLAQGSATINSNIVKVTVTINEATIELKNSKSAGAILDNSGRKVGYVYDVCIEDSYDDDYNDIYINLVGWERKG